MSDKAPQPAAALIRVMELFEGKSHLFGPYRSLMAPISHAHSWFQKLKQRVALLFRSGPEEPSLVLQSLLEQPDEGARPDPVAQELPAAETNRSACASEQKEPEPSTEPDEWKQKYMELSSQAAALHYQLYKVDADRKALEMRYAASQGEVKTSKLLIAKLRKEIDELKRNREDGE